MDLGLLYAVVAGVAAVVNAVLLNILSNAFKYTPAGGYVEYSVDQLESSDDSHATYRFVVKDTGIGMSIVKKLVDLMDGTIKITSAKGEGTTVEIILTFEIAVDLLEDQGIITETEEDRQNALDAGMNDHLAKPIDMDAVIRTMAKYKDWKSN